MLLDYGSNGDLIKVYTIVPIAPDDFTSFSDRMISFESDTLIEIIQVSVVNDGVHEPSESFAGVLTTPSGQTGVQIEDATTTITIFDDDSK